MSKPKTKETDKGPDFIANIDTANEEIARLTATMAEEQETHKVEMKELQATFEADAKESQEKHDAAVKSSQAKHEAEMKALMEKKDAEVAEAKKNGLKAAAAAGVTSPANISTSTEVDDSKIKEVVTAGPYPPGLQRAINANAAAQQRNS